MKTFISLCIFGAMPFFAAAQTSQPKNRSPFGLSVGFMPTMLDASSFNGAIPANTPELTDGFVLLPVFGAILAPVPNAKFYLEVNVAAWTRKKTESGIRLEEMIGFGDFNLCYKLVDKGHRKLDAGLGVGSGQWKASYYADQPGLTFATASSVPAGERTFRAPNMYYINPRIAYRYGLDKDNTILVGITAGYRVPVNSRGWELYKNKLANSPDQNLGGAYAAFSLMVGY